MLRYFLLFGMIVVISCVMGLGASSAALRDHLPQADFNVYAGPSPSNDTVFRDPNGRVVFLSAPPKESPALNCRKIECPPYSARKTALERICPRDTDQEKCQGLALLGHLLQEPPAHKTLAQNAWPFDTPARQGPDSGSVARGGGPVAGPVKQRGPIAGSGPQAPEDLSPPTEAPKRLPFQGASPAPTSPDVSAGSQKSEEGTGVDGARKHLVEPPKESATGGRTTKKKPAARQGRRGDESADSKPYSVTPPTRRRSAGKQPVVDAGSMPAPPVGGTGSSALPPLPPALPYSPPTASTPTPISPAVTPGADGTVMARIPGSPSAAGPGSAPPPPATAMPQGPAAPVPLHPNNPISGFIMDSFGEPSKPVPVQAPPPLQVQARDPRQPQQAPQQPPQGASSGVLGQLGSDVQQLGSGIKGVFERIMPGR